MSVAESVNPAEFLDSKSALTSDEIDVLQQVIAGSAVGDVSREFRERERNLDLSSASEDEKQRLGITAYLLALVPQADRLLSEVSKNALGLYYHGILLTSVGRHQEAEKRFAAASKAGYDRVECELQRAGAIRCSGDLDSAEAALRAIASEAASRAEYSFQMGCILADRGDTFGAIEYFERAVDMDPHHSRALFWLASENSLRGNDEDAIRLYEQSLSKPPYFLGALLNLGLLYEDRENYKAAEFCFRRIIEFDPNHERARLYLKDIEATDDMFYDEDQVREKAKLDTLLGRSVTEFELSVRSRNCLSQMNIRTLKDLTEVSEQELLSGKNFGETSLQEIRKVLDSHGLSIGMNLSQVHEMAMQEEQANLSHEEQQMLGKPVSELNLSVRARKCMVRLNIQTFGQLVQRTADELLASRNFGVTSLNEIRQKLTDFGLKLRND